jgi:ppGpp synthetase/RelA/SpoT-type nucleotidyltranferase
VAADEHLDQYRALRPTYERFAERLADLIRTALVNREVRFHEISYRAKEPESLGDKLQRLGLKSDTPLADLTDLSGVRVVAYDIEAVAKISAICQEILDVDQERSVSHESRLAENEFGYQSDHWIVRVPPDREFLDEWIPFKGLIAEVQVRTVLQHAWATVSHGLQYKREADVPLALQRRLFLIAGVLEVADAEFESIRQAHLTLSHEVETSATRHPGSWDAPIDSVSTATFVRESDDLAALVQIARSAGVSVHGDSIGQAKESVRQVVNLSSFLALDNISDLRAQIVGHGPLFRRFIERLMDLNEHDSWLMDDHFVLLLALIWSATDREGLEDWLRSAEGWNAGIVELILEAAEG